MVAFFEITIVSIFYSVLIVSFRFLLLPHLIVQCFSTGPYGPPGGREKVYKGPDDPGGDKGALMTSGATGRP